ncbi:hypothetical protein OH76DRAFT_555589 [Lentinus brumalis]|uniref:Uncharacterized protein n=1 Tax=Lentinus brumalis TaxID=2498619 RepID=A0A371D981_9APHY|nr:hypothetical protein OH76DRAFT_555589 [Polyporus brumalis]
MMSVSKSTPRVRPRYPCRLCLFACPSRPLSAPLRLHSLHRLRYFQPHISLPARSRTAAHITTLILSNAQPTLAYLSTPVCILSVGSPVITGLSVLIQKSISAVHTTFRCLPLNIFLPFSRYAPNSPPYTYRHIHHPTAPPVASDSTYVSFLDALRRRNPTCSDFPRQVCHRLPVSFQLSPYRYRRLIVV